MSHNLRNDGQQTGGYIPLIHLSQAWESAIGSSARECTSDTCSLQTKKARMYCF